MSTVDSEAGQGQATIPVQREHVITRRSVTSWVLYDLANTIFSMGVVSLFFPMFIKRGVGEGSADSVYGFITSLSMAVIFIVSPVLGAITDKAKRRLPFLITSTLICVVLTAGIGRGPWTLSLVLFVIANIAYQAGLQFYDALLPDVSTEENRGKIGGIGVGIGYLGSYVAVLIGVIVATDLPDPLPALPRNPTEVGPLFLWIAIAFLAFALPSFFFVRERGNPHPSPINPSTVFASIKETVRTLKSGKEYPGLLRFLIGRMFYTDSINTVIAIMFLYASNISETLGTSPEGAEKQAYTVMLVAISFAVAGGFIWGRWSDKLGPKRTLDRVLISWFFIFAAAASVGIFTLPIWTLFVVASVAGFSLGGVWAADRPLMLRLTPPARVGEFYGLYGMVGRFSNITGPLIWALVLSRTNAAHVPVGIGQGIGILTLLIMVLIGFYILQAVSDAPREWTGTDLVR